MKPYPKTQSGFTLIELLVVVLILGVLAAIALPAYASMVRRARYAEAKLQMNTIAKEVQAYRVENGQYPPDVNGRVKPEGVSNWPGKVPYDSYFDYDHWGVGSKQCYVQIGYAGEGGTRSYPLHEKNAPVSGFREFDNSLVLGVALYDCSNGRGGIR
jgi:type II secretion system protein G